MTEGTIRCAILGAGGHGRMVLASLVAAGTPSPAAFLDPEPGLWSTEISGIPVLGDDDLLDELRERGIRGFALGLGGAGTGGGRRALYERARRAGLDPCCVIHPTSLALPGVELGSGCQLMPRCVVNPGTWLGTGVLVNTAAVVEHDCVLGDHVHVASGAVLAGGVDVGAGSLIGAGATVIQGIRIGAGVRVGAGAVVVEDVPAGSTVMGVPARARESVWNRGAP